MPFFQDKDLPPDRTGEGEQRKFEADAAGPGRVEIVGKPAQFGSRRRLSSPIELLIINDLRTTLEAPGSFR